MLGVIGSSFKYQNTQQRHDFFLLLKMLSKFFPSHVILNTCNRSELYFSGPFSDKLKDHSFPYLKEGKEAICHLLNVLCGLDSALHGEDEIRAQIKKAYYKSSISHKCDKNLHRLFQRSFFFSRKIKNETKITNAGLSYAKAACDWVLQKTPYPKSKILLLGAGNMGKTVVREFCKKGYSKNISLASGKPELLEKINKEFSITTLSREKALHNIKQYDALITATAAPHPIITLQNIKNHKNIRDLYICDISANLNVENEIFQYAKESKRLDDFIREFNNFPSTKPSVISALNMIKNASEKVMTYGN